MRAVEIWPARGEPGRNAAATAMEDGEAYPGLRLDLEEIRQA